MTTATLATGNRTMADGRKASAQPRRAGRPAHGGAVPGAAGDGTGDGDTERGQERPRGAAAQAGGTSKVRWRSSPARTRRRLNRIRLGGPSPSGRTW